MYSEGKLKVLKGSIDISTEGWENMLKTEKFPTDRFDFIDKNLEE